MKGRSVFSGLVSLTVLATVFLSSLLKSQPSLAHTKVNNPIFSTGELAQIDRTQSIFSETARDVELEKAILQANTNYDSRSIEIFGSQARYFYNKIDLNGDNKPEVLVHVVGPTFCGTAGCTTLIFKSVGQTYQLVSEIRLSRLPIIVTNQKTNGWNDLILNARGGRAATGNSGLYLVQFNGRTYPEAPDRGIKLSENFTITGKDLFNTNRSNDGIVLQPQNIQTVTGRSPASNPQGALNRSPAPSRELRPGTERSPSISQRTQTERDGKQTIQSLPDGKYLYGQVIDPKQPDMRVMFRKTGNTITAVKYNYGKNECFQGTANRNTITNTIFPNASRDGKLSFVGGSNILGDNSYRLRLEEAPDEVRRSLEGCIKAFSNNQTFIAQNKAPQRFIDIWTDNIFSNLHPELSGRKIQYSEREYIIEWQAIQTVVANNLTPKIGCTGDSGWGLSEFDGVEVRTGKRLLTSTVLNKVADAIFYTRHPELGDRKIQPGEYKLTNEWMKIRQAIWTMPWC